MKEENNSKLPGDLSDYLYKPFKDLVGLLKSTINKGAEEEDIKLVGELFKYVLSRHLETGSSTQLYANLTDLAKYLDCDGDQFKQDHPIIYGELFGYLKLILHQADMYSLRTIDRKIKDYGSDGFRLVELIDHYENDLVNNHEKKQKLPVYATFEELSSKLENVSKQKLSWMLTEFRTVGLIEREFRFVTRDEVEFYYILGYTIRAELRENSLIRLARTLKNPYGTIERK